MIKIRPFILFVCLIFITSALVIHYKDSSFTSSLFSEINDESSYGTITTGSVIFLLRSISIIIPALPGTYCSVLAGYIFGIKNGLFLIFCADLLACSSSFLIARNLGRPFLIRLLGKNQIRRIESLSKKYLEKNFFLMTAFLLTQFFDFVCYSIGLTKVSWKKFMPALIVSIIISDVPFVAGGHALNELKDIQINDILNGKINVLEGPYLSIFLFSILVVFFLGLLTNLLDRKSNIS